MSFGISVCVCVGVNVCVRERERGESKIQLLTGFSSPSSFSSLVKIFRQSWRSTPETELDPVE